MNKILLPEWPAPENVRSLVTTRQGGCSESPFDSLNLAEHVGDDPQVVSSNRHRLRIQYQLPTEPFWLSQVHGCSVASPDRDQVGCQADAVYTDRAGVVCAVLTADCLPLLITDWYGREVCAVHAGWRGLAAGIIENTLQRFEAAADQLMVWLGPAIGPTAFEVLDDVRQCFLDCDQADECAFTPSRSGHWLADIYTLARLRLVRAGVGSVAGGKYCTVTQQTLFYSYRRDGVTGRMASLIWLEK
ncbi:MAG: peptidoglycan editing factor PgeF [Candidatus Thiodiazotropha sp. (ex Lucinoma aequizonata)]|nr:peptidoglycan editing factor PgeF [Candidatus Thiodiazotropha sp. (ex Lucinoma aequizonata)]MCU7887170.1 peptidoglycan editing factor PgeF [Candidatus Thiodiazotropha sp. (ex Lucinoma aequizonata)]MCU7894436.1 peptidoglycan editing factor PgeF [Candidatus Thiodiazotropha sp. (ex Lucinoma aequizonata)]MCU7898809.1 peptidoglycan editing factor PgeF [Candidatus Thiodiazotropha sp. (ex Lucinoma aequizonata)]MCU7903813.1 peptidoglycan editing factor PgeF [Candidatus Thiodiazotropha sp. (ex Lucino